MFWLLSFLGIKGLIALVVILCIMPVIALWMAISDRQPAWLLVIGAWVIALGVPNEWFVNPFDGSEFGFVGACIYLVCWIVVFGGSVIGAKAVVDPN